jgi:hypothetical protein
MVPNLVRFWRSAMGAICLCVTACAGVSGDALNRDKIETMINGELATGDGAQAIQAFFQRHEFAYTYDASLRRYASTIPMGGGPTVSIYIYTDTEQKLTVAQVVAQASPRPRRTAPLPDPALEFHVQPRRF